MKHAALAASVLALAGSIGSPQQALAQAQYPAFTSKPVNLRAGPSRDYPVIAVLPPNFQVMVQGCLADFAWCDVTTGYDRGWVYAGNIFYASDSGSQPIVTWGPMLGIGVIGFAFNDYWPRYYVNRPWYRERHRWERVRPPRAAVPLPAPAAPPPGWQGRGAQPPYVQPRPVPQPQPQPRPAPPVQLQAPPSMPPGQQHPGFRGAAPVPPQGGVPPRTAPAPTPTPVPRPVPQQQQQEREHG